MSFESILENIVAEAGGCLGVALMGTDGIPITQIDGPAPGENPLGGDFASAGVEFGRIASEVQKAGRVLNGGQAEETTISYSRFVLIFRRIDEEILLVLALAPDGNLGKARYLIRRHLPALREEF